MNSNPEWKLDAASFVVVANRLPVEQVELPDGSADWRPSPGGLVTAFEPIMHRRRGAWVGWHGAADEELEPFEDDGLELVPVPLSASDVAEYYEGFSNATLWPLYHDAIATPQFHRERRPSPSPWQRAGDVRSTPLPWLQLTAAPSWRGPAAGSRRASRRRGG